MLDRLVDLPKLFRDQRSGLSTGVAGCAEEDARRSGREGPAEWRCRRNEDLAKGPKLEGTVHREFGLMIRAVRV